MRNSGGAKQAGETIGKRLVSQFEGLVLEILPDACYRIRLDNGHQLVAYPPAE